MEFWERLAEELKRQGFSAVQINRLRDQFGSLDAAALLNTPHDQLLPAMTGRTVAEKREKIETLLAVAEAVQNRLGGNGRDGTIVVHGQLTGPPLDTRWQNLTVGLIDPEQPGHGPLFQVQASEAGEFRIEAPEEEWRRAFPSDAPQFLVQVYWNGRALHTSPEPMAVWPDPPRRAISVALPEVALHRLLAATSPERLRQEIDFHLIADVANIPAEVQAQLRRANVTRLGDLFNAAASGALDDTGLSPPVVQKLYGLGRWTAITGDVGLAEKLVEGRLDSLARLARVSRDRIERQFEREGRSLSEEEKGGLDILLVHARAGYNVIADAFVEDRYWYDISDHLDPIFGIVLTPIEQDDTPTEELCAECDDCAIVFSPLAYAYDLLSFTESNWGLEPQETENVILQEIDLDCDTAQAPVPQIVLAIGVLERYLRNELSASLAGDVQWQKAYRAGADAVLSLLGLDPHASAPPAHQEPIYAAAQKSNPALQDLLTLEARSREYYGTHVAGSVNNTPAASPESGDQAYAAYLLEKMQAEAEKNRQLEILVQQLRALLSPLFLDYRQRLIDSTGTDAAVLELQLFIDLHTDPCQETTRVIQVIQSLQSFILSIRTGTVADNPRASVKGADIDPQHFDEVSWNWLQTYAAWNAAIYVLVYPENVLSPPTGRPMTGFFRRLASQFAAGRITGGEVARVEQSFVGYYLRFGTLRPIAASVVGQGAKERLMVFARSGSSDDYGLWMNPIETDLLPSDYVPPPDREQVNADGWVEVYGWRTASRPVMALPFGGVGKERFVVLAQDASGGWTTFRVTGEGILEGESKLEQTGGLDEVVLSTQGSFGGRTPVVWSRYGDQWYGSELDEYTGEWLERQTIDPFAGEWVVISGKRHPWFKAPGFHQSGPVVRVGNSAAAARWSAAVNADVDLLVRAGTGWPIQPYSKNLRPFTPGYDYGTFSPLLAWSHAVGISFIIFRSNADQHIYLGRIWLNQDPTDPPHVRRISEKIEAYADDRTWPAELAEGVARDIRLAERYLYFPLLAGWVLNRSGDYISAHDWYRRLYDPYASPRQVFPFDTYFQGAWQRSETWLHGIEDPDALASRRGGSYLRHTVLMMTKNLLDWADHEFALNNVESRNRARELYLLAGRVLQAPAMNYACADQLQALEFEVAYRLAGARNGGAGDTGVSRAKARLIREAVARLGQINLREVIREAKAKIEDLLQRDVTLQEFEEELQNIVLEAEAEAQLRQPKPASLKVRFDDDRERRGRLERVLDPGWNWNIRGAGDGDSPSVGSVTAVFCVPKNPLLLAYRTRIETRLALLRNCLDINGEPTQPQLTGSLQGRVINTFGQLQAAMAAAAMEPPRYRYDFLIEKARQHAALAQQLGSLMLSTIEKRDSAVLALLQAEIAEEVAAATITLRALGREEALQAVEITGIQFSRADAELEFWQGRVGAGMTIMGAGGLNAAEMAGMALMGTSGVLQGMAALGYMFLAGPSLAVGLLGGAATTVSGGVGVATAVSGYGALAGLAGMASGVAAMGGAVISSGGLILSGLQAAAGSAGTFGSLALTFASFERRWEEWEHQHQLAGIGLQLAEAQLRQAQFRVRITEQEQAIAELQHGHARLIIDYLKSQFSNEQLYQWMIGVLQEAYRGVMQNATNMARLAQYALEFERQQPITAIQGDYWSIDEATLTQEQQSSGLLGAERLLADMSHLDEWKIRTDKRRLQLSKTISLSQMLPSEFMQLRETGAMDFSTLMEWFDWDFPGHYMRLIKSVKVSVIALVPPVDGIHATLSNKGFSRVVMPGSGGDFIEVDALQRFPETVALDSPINDSGVFVLDYKDPMLLPFEGLGVATGWRFELPHASNRLNFDSLVEVLFTIEYTAYPSADYRGQVIARLGNRKSSDLVISLRNNYPDQWYDLHNPEDASTDQTVTINLPAYTFPGVANNQLGIRHLMMLLVGLSGKDRNGDVAIQKAGVTPVIVASTDENGAFSTRSGAAVDSTGMPQTIFAVDPANPNGLLPSGSSEDGQLLDPRGEWQITFMQNWFADAGSVRAIDELSDVILIPTIEYEIAWP